MTLSADIAFESYTIVDENAPLNFGHMWEFDDELAVFEDGTLLDLGADYSLVGAGLPSGGTVNPVAAVLGSKWVIYRMTRLAQIAVPSDAVAGFGLDRVTRMVQDVRRDVDRSLKVDFDEVELTSIPRPILPGHALVGNETGTGFTYSDTNVDEATTALNDALDEEIIVRGLADTALQEALAAEAETRKGADDTLMTLITGSGPADPDAVKTYLELENVDNTSDVDKPVSTAQQDAINGSTGLGLATKTIPDSMEFMTVTGYETPGDKGSADLVRDDVGGYFPSLGGKKWKHSQTVLSPLMFGAKDRTNNPGFNSSPAFTACLTAAARSGAKIIMDAPVDLYGGHKIPFGVHIEWLRGAYTRQLKRSVTGGFLLTNGIGLDGNWLPLDQRRGIVFENFQYDGSDYPIHTGTVAAGSTSSEVILDAGASSVDGFYNGDIIEISTGAASGLATWAYILSYVGATRTVTIDGSRTPGVGWGTNPPEGSQYRIGYNDPAILFGFGAHDVVISGGTIKNLPWDVNVAYGYGSKAINLEQGHTNCIIESMTFENMGAGVFLTGRAGAWPVGTDPMEPPRVDVAIKMNNISCLNVGAPLVAFGTTVSPGPLGNPDLLYAEANNWTLRNCGHNPNRLFNSGEPKEKSAPIILGGAENISLRGFQLHNQSTYPETSPGYPSEPNASAFGLTGPIGSVFKGWGRNINISDFEYFGDCDTLFNFKRPRELNVDAGGVAILHGERFDVQNFKHYGTAQYLVDVDPTQSLRIARSQLSGKWDNIQIGTLTGGIVGPNMAAGDNVLSPYIHITAEVIRPALGQGPSIPKLIIEGRLADIAASQNTFASTKGIYNHMSDERYFSAIRTGAIRGDSVTIADDALATVAIPFGAGIIEIYSRTSGLRMEFDFRTLDINSNPAAQVGTGPLIPANTSVVIGALAAAGGADGSFNIGIGSDQVMYVSNRRGASVTFSYIIKGIL